LDSGARGAETLRAAGSSPLFSPDFDLGSPVRMRRARPSIVSETPDRILDAAERLFAHQGLAATSLRSITLAAGVNTAAIHYHFGSKDELVRAIFERRIAPLARARLERLEWLEALHPEGPLPLEPLVEAFVAPLAQAGSELRDELERLGSLLAWLRVESEGEGDGPLLSDRADGVRGRFARALCRGRDLELAEAADRFHYAMGAIVQVLRQEPGDERPLRSDDELVVLRTRLDRLIGFIAAGLGAPPANSLTRPQPSRRVAQESSIR
jgi:AcrR family transcriptional regulator